MATKKSTPEPVVMIPRPAPSDTNEALLSDADFILEGVRGTNIAESSEGVGNPAPVTPRSEILGSWAASCFDYLLDLGFSRGQLFYIIFSLIIAGSVPGVVLYAIQGKEALAAIFTCVWTGTAAVLVLLVTINNHRKCERSIAKEMTKRIEPPYIVPEDKLEGMKEKFESISLCEYACFNLFPKPFFTQLRLRITDKLQLRALEYARNYSDDYDYFHWKFEDVKKSLGWKYESGYRVQNVRKMVNAIKDDSNPALPARIRWINFLARFFLPVTYMINFVPVYSCVKFLEPVPWGATGVIIGGTVFFTLSLIVSASLDRDAAVLAPPGSMFGVSLVLAFGALGQALFSLALSGTDLCTRMDEYWVPVLVFCVFIIATMLLAMRILVGKLVDYCELRLALLSLGQGPESGNLIRDKHTPLAYIESRYPVRSKGESLNLEAVEKLKDLSGELWERWGIGLGVLFLGLAPSALKLGYAMWQGAEGESPSEVLPDEIFAMVGTMFVLVILLLSDKDLLRWLNKEDLAIWVVLSLLTLGSQIFGAVLGLEATWRSTTPKRIVFILVPALFAVSVQLCACVWSALVLDLKLIKLMYRGHTYVSKTALRRLKRNTKEYKAPLDGLDRDPLPKDDYESDSDNEEEEQQALTTSDQGAGPSSRPLSSVSILQH